MLLSTENLHFFAVIEIFSLCMKFVSTILCFAFIQSPMLNFFLDQYFFTVIESSSIITLNVLNQIAPHVNGRTNVRNTLTSKAILTSCFIIVQIITTHNTAMINLITRRNINKSYITIISLDFLDISNHFFHHISILTPILYDCVFFWANKLNCWNINRSITHNL